MSQTTGVEPAARQGNGRGQVAAGRTVRDAAFEVMRRHGLTRIFGNPGSTEISFLTDLPPDLEFVLGLHEGSVVGMASGYALARGEPAFVNLHTAAGLGNAINAIANARDCRAPLVILVGQQDRRQMAFEPFLTGRALERLAGEYPVWRQLPSRAQDVPGAIARAYHEAKAARGGSGQPGRPRHLAQGQLAVLGVEGPDDRQPSLEGLHEIGVLCRFAGHSARPFGMRTLAKTGDVVRVAGDRIRWDEPDDWR